MQPQSRNVRTRITMIWNERGLVRLLLASLDCSDDAIWGATRAVVLVRGKGPKDKGPCGLGRWASSDRKYPLSKYYPSCREKTAVICLEL